MSFGFGGEFVVSAADVDGSALLAPADVASVPVETFAGQPLVTVPV